MAGVNKACPWHRGYSVGGFVLDSVVRLVDDSVSTLIAPFGSSLMKRLIRLRRSFTLEISEIADEESRFAGAVLAKIAQRGFPAPCSLRLERLLLDQANEVSLLDWKEDILSGAIVFKVRPWKANLVSLIKACYFAELLLDDFERSSLIERYQSLCTPPEREFFNMVFNRCSRLGFPNLTLFLIPQRLMITMVRLTRPSGELQELGPDRRVDFAVEVPDLDRGGWLRLVIEIDDESHSGAHEVLDRLRDETLRRNGWEVWRLRVREKNKWPEHVEELVNRMVKAITLEVLKAARELCDIEDEKKQALSNLVLLPIAEAQLLAVVARWLYSKGTANLKIASPQGAGLGTVLECIGEYLSNLEKLYGLRPLGRPKLVASERDADVVYFLLPSAKAWDLLEMDYTTVVTPTVSFSDYEDALLEQAFPRLISEEVVSNRVELEDVLTFFLQQLFRKAKFREGQVKIISRALQHKPVVGLLPTAAGKSLCYQIASLLQPGFSIVVQPLRSLMWDQQDNLDMLGIHRTTAIMSHAEVTPDEENRLKEEGYKAIELGFRFFIFISPERFQIPEFRKQVQSFVSRYPIPYCVIDEAHCVSEWGHDFRPAYLNLGWLVPRLCQHQGHKPTFIALTGTASQNVLTDILRELNISDPEAVVTPESFDRSELSFDVIRISSESERVEKLKNLLRMMTGYRPGQLIRTPPSGLIFSFFVDDQNLGVSSLEDKIKNDFPELHRFIDVYSGKKPSGFTGSGRDWEFYKIKLQERFKRNEIPIIVCTHSFGMGIDKPDIRFTIHAMLPRSLEEFYQQAGRAGRDGKQSHCVIIFSDNQPHLADELLDPIRTPIEKTDELINRIPRDQRSDPLRNIWFLRNSFLGKETDKSIVKQVWDYLFPYLPSHKGDSITVEVPFNLRLDTLKQQKIDSDKDESHLEKAIYRLLSIGAVEDYMKDWTNRSFIVTIIRHPIEELYNRFVAYLTRYATEGEISRYLPERQPSDYYEAVLTFAYQVVEFVYDKIERRRRRAMWEMLQAVRDAEKLGIQKFREQLNNYMQESEFTQPVKELTKRVLPSEWLELINKAEGVDGLIKLLGACRRQLEEFPEHPGLLLLTGFCRLHYSDEGLRDISNAFYVLKRDYPNIDRIFVATQLVFAIKERFPTKLENILETLLEHDPSREMARLCYSVAVPYSSVYSKALLILAAGIVKILREGGKSYERIAPRSSPS